MCCPSLQTSLSDSHHLYLFIFFKLFPTWNTTFYAFALYFLAFFTGVAPSGHTIAGDDWLAPTGIFLCGCCRASRQTGFFFLLLLLMCSVTLPLLSTCDILPPQSDPTGHSHTERYRHTHHLNPPVTFCVLLIEL